MGKQGRISSLDDMREKCPVCGENVIMFKYPTRESMNGFWLAECMHFGPLREPSKDSKTWGQVRRSDSHKFDLP